MVKGGVNYFTHRELLPFSYFLREGDGGWVRKNKRQ